MLKRYGTEYGGFFYPDNLNGLDSNSIIYCVGAGEDISHDIEIAHQLQSKVYIFDPTPRSIEHVQYVKDVFDSKKIPVNNKKYGGGDLNYWNVLLKNKIDSQNIIFQDIGIYTQSDTLKFYSPSNPDFISHSLLHGMKSDNYINVKVKDLKSIMSDLGHDHIDLLKLDIEGSECDVINKMLDDNILPTYLSVDFDLGWHGERIKDMNRCTQTINRLYDFGYKLLKSSGSDYSFLYKP
jgi:FkbM family methyltransferase